MESVKVKVGSVLGEGFHWCPACKVRVVNNSYGMCYGCHLKWKKVYNDCCDHGWPCDIARCKADEVYSGRNWAVIK